jgi:ubiquinone/menaquinone biosynthesis C-methylase UbiE
MDEIVDYYDELAKTYDSNRFENTYGTFIDKQERAILQQLLTHSEEMVLDMPCGSGRFLNFAQLGIDASKEMVRVSQAKFPSKTISQADAAQTQIDDHTIDTIISFHFFMHLNEEKMKQILKECERILKPQGRIIFDIPSAKRRKLLQDKRTNWHGGFSLTNKEISELNPNFNIRRTYGLLFVPIHRIPKRLRSIFITIDRILSNSFLKEYSSYQIIELVKK